MKDYTQLRVRRGHPVHGFGFVADPEGHRYTNFLLRASARAATLAREFDLIQYRPAIWDQWVTSSCVGHGWAGSLTTAMVARGISLKSPIWPRGIYTNARIIDRPFVTGNAKPQPLLDHGAQPNSATRAIIEWGVGLEADQDEGKLATSSDYSQHLESHINDEPQLMELLDESRLKPLVSAHTITAVGEEKINQMCLAIQVKTPPMAAVDASSERFQNFDGNGVLDFTGIGFDHWVYFDAFRTNNQGRKELRLVNSWGLGSWTPDGTAWVTPNFIISGTTNILVPDLR